jgi:hypothetical protein
MALTGLWLISRMEGANEHLKEGLEGFFSESFSSYAKIESLNNLSIYPVIQIDVKGLSLKKEPEGREWLVADRLLAVMRFWDVFFSRRHILDMKAESLEVRPGHLLPGELLIKELSLENSNKTQSDAFIDISGRYNFFPFDATVDINRKEGKNHEEIYVFPGSGNLDISLGELDITAEYYQPDSREDILELNDIDIKLSGKRLGRGNLKFSQIKENFIITGQMTSGGSNWVINVSVPGKKESGLKGGIVFSSLDINDTGPQGKLSEIAGIMHCLLKHPRSVPSLEKVVEKEDFFRPGFITIDIKKIKDGDRETGSIKFTVAYIDNGYKLGGTENDPTSPAGKIESIIPVFETAPGECSRYGALD